MEKGEKVVGGDEMRVTVKFMGRSIPMTLSPNSTVREVKSLLQPLTNVLPRGQKLIFKGRVLEDDATLRSCDVADGAKLMLMATQGLHQGAGPIRKETPTLSRMAEKVNQDKTEKRVFTAEKSQFERWKASGVIALSGCNLKLIPDEVWSCRTARVLDLSHNSLQNLPISIGNLSSIQKLLLHANEFTDGSLSWDGLATLKSLTVLSLNQNQIKRLPAALALMTNLKELHIANNELECLPGEIGSLNQLQVLKADNNRISTVNVSIGECTALVEIDLSSNLLVDLPETFGNLKNLKSLNISNNGLKSIPGTLFHSCIQLSTLDVHNTEITMDILRQLEGWEDFDNRRRSKHQKQLDFRVGEYAEFDEGADKK